MDFTKLKLNRRQILKLASISGVSTIVGCGDTESTAVNVKRGAIGKDGAEVTPWTNWSQNQFSTPNERLVPQDIQQLCEMIKKTQQRIRLVGAGHSFSPLVPINETQMTLAYFQGISNINQQTKTFDVAANTFLASAGEQLWNQGISLENMPDINTQTFGGAIATSTHGTGRNYGSMSSTVKKMHFVNGMGEEVICSDEKDSDLFNAARTNLGVLGTTTNMTIQAQPRYHLKERSWMMDLNEGLEQAETLRDSHDHFEMYAIPHSDYILGIGINRIPESELLTSTVNSGDAYGTFKTLSKVVDALPFMRSFIINRACSTVDEEIRTGRNYEVFGNVRDILFNEMEYTVPAEYGVACLREILDTIKRLNIDVVFPIEYRYIKADDIWLSPFYKQDGCAISCHNFHDQDYKKYFAAIEPIFWKYDGRPHWGKIHTLTAKEQAARYPMFNDFLRVREHMDPKKIFTNDHINSVLGLS